MTISTTSVVILTTVTTGTTVTTTGPRRFPSLSAVDKQVPVAGGMASGSADAAASLLATVELLLHGPRAAAHGFDQTPAPSPEELHAMAVSLGADVPFCLRGGTALGRGIGDDLVPVMIRGSYHWALVMDPRGLSTAEVFARLDTQRDAAARGERPDVRAPAPEDVQRALLSGDPDVLAGHLREAVNDLQAPAISLRPDLRVPAGTDAGALACGLGSGPTVACAAGPRRCVATTLAAEGVGGRAVATATATSARTGRWLTDCRSPSVLSTPETRPAPTDNRGPLRPTMADAPPAAVNLINLENSRIRAHHPARPGEPGNQRRRPDRVVGLNGGSKSLLKILSGADTADAGRVSRNNELRMARSARTVLVGDTIGASVVEPLGLQTYSGRRPG